jgi:hypothetical protein
VDQDFRTNRLCPLFLKSVCKKSAHKRVYSTVAVLLARQQAINNYRETQTYLKRRRRRRRRRRKKRRGRKEEEKKKKKSTDSIQNATCPIRFTSLLNCTEFLLYTLLY